MEDLTYLLGNRVVSKEVEMRVGSSTILLKVGEVVEIITVDPELDRVLIQYPDGRLDWKRSFLITEYTTKSS